MGPHEEFLELCAVATSGELTDEERKRLDAHLAECSECREALRQFEAIADRAMPALAPELAGREVEREPFSTATAEAKFLERLTKEENHGGVHPSGPASEYSPDEERGHFTRSLRRAEFWAPYAAGVLLLLSLGIVLMRSRSEKGTAATQQGSAVLESPVPGKPTNGSSNPENERVVAELRHSLQLQVNEVVRLKNQLKDLENKAQSSDAEKAHVTEERDALAKKLETEEASLSKIQKDLETREERDIDDSAHVAALEAKIADLSHLLEQREKTIDRTQVLLERDRDIRELMGARDLYVAEVYDVGQNGKTQKPCGRVFLTKGKSLIFYAFDLDEQPGLKGGNTFQAWGRRGPDREQAFNLGIFFEDNVAKKRWVVKSEDTKTLAQIDAVFVTIEPKGGSAKPTGKQLLFAYLKTDSNHP